MNLTRSIMASAILLLSNHLTAEVGSPLPEGQFVNAIAEGADPWVTRDPNEPRYLWCFSEGNRGIALHAGNKLSTLSPKKVIWRTPETGPCSRGIWAPELHYLEDRWHIYFAADDGKNPNHRTYVLRSETKDPFGEYELHGPLATGDGPDGLSPNIWAIDMTPLEVNGKLYAIWSGWDTPISNDQHLYIAPMKSGVELAGPRVLICSNDTHPWEFTRDGGEGKGLNEGAQVLKQGDRTFVTYSCGASWAATYKLGMLEFIGTEPLDPASWKKFPKPVFQSLKEIIGTGHSCFVRSPDGAEWWHVYHAKISPKGGWQRRIHIEPFKFDGKGLPQLGEPISLRSPLEVPSGEITPVAELPARFSMKDEVPDTTFAYYGHHQLMEFTPDGLLLGGPTLTPPTNPYRSGEKLLLDRTLPDDLNIEVTIDFRGRQKSRDGGILFRTTAPSIGMDAHRGYFAGLIPATNRVILGKADGNNWKQIKIAEFPIDPDKPHRLRVETRGNAFKAIVNGKTVIEANDVQYPSGSVGLRVVDSSVLFSNLGIETATP